MRIADCGKKRRAAAPVGEAAPVDVCCREGGCEPERPPRSQTLSGNAGVPRISDSQGCMREGTPEADQRLRNWSFAQTESGNEASLSKPAAAAPSSYPQSAIRNPQSAIRNPQSAIPLIVLRWGRTFCPAPARRIRKAGGRGGYRRAVRARGPSSLPFARWRRSA